VKRPAAVLGALLLGAALLPAQDLGRTDRLGRDYLAQTVRRGLPRINLGPSSGAVPFWPSLDRQSAEARSLEPGDDGRLLAAWIAAQEGDRAGASALLTPGWPRPTLLRHSRTAWAQTLFAAWPAEPGAAAFTDAWLAYEDKAYSPAVLLRGLEVLEKADPSAFVPLLTQARQLYPEDRRFLLAALRRPAEIPLAAALVARDRTNTGGFSPSALAAAVHRSPALAAALTGAGYPAQTVQSAVGRDYGLWLSGTEEQPADGAWAWDADRDGRAESRLVFSAGLPVTWSRSDGEGGLWTVRFEGGRPAAVTERRGGAVWVLTYEGYPVARQLEYRWGDHRLVYRFAPLAVTAGLWPEDRFRSGSGRLPAALAEIWLPLDSRLLAQQASSLETWSGAVRQQVLYLAGGQVWLETEDTNLDGRDDQWSYFRGGRLASVYRDLEGRGQATLRELYVRGELTQVQSRLPAAARPELALFPAEGVQLWDPQGRGRPLDRLFLWSGGQVQALVFSGSALPWETMPSWEPRP